MRQLCSGLLKGIVLATLLSSSLYVKAQGATAPALSAEARKALGRLGEIESGIPDGDWRVRVGDMAHGENISLDDSNWSVLPAGNRKTYGQECTWYRTTLVLPPAIAGYSYSGAQLYFQLNVRAEGGTPEIIYVDGNRVAMGEDIEPTLLTANAKPGQIFHIAVKILHTAGDKHMYRDTPGTYSLELSPSRPNPIDFHVEVETAHILLPSITSDSKKIADEQALLEQAVGMLDIKALDSGDQAKFDASLRAAQQHIEPLKPILRSVKMELVGNTHMDTAWLWPWTETVDTAKRTYTTALQLMTEYPDYKFTQSVALYFEWMQEKYPDIFSQIQDRVKQGRWELVGGMWVEPDLNMPDGESQVRQLLIGKRFFQKQMGIDVRIGWNPDSFGFNWQLPQIYKKSGVDYFVTQKLMWNETNKLPLKLFWWQSPDGSRVLTYFTDDYTKDPEPSLLAQDTVIARKLSPGEDSLMHLYGIGDHGGGPTRVMLDRAKDWMEPDKIFPKMEFSTAGAYFADVEKRVTIPPGTPIWNYKAMSVAALTLPAAMVGSINVPVWNDELYLEFHRGVYTTQARHKQNMREAEEEILNAEKVASITWLGGIPYPEVPINESWKKVLENQFHDTSSGSGVSSVYMDAQRDYDSIRQVTEEITRGSLKEIAAHVDTQSKYGAVPLLVFNPLAWNRTGTVEADIQLPRATEHGIEVTTADGRPVLSQVLKEDKSTARYRLLIRAEDVPSLGYRTLQVKDGIAPSKSDLLARGTTLENQFLKVIIDPSSGCITHLIQKQSGFDAIALGGCGNELQTFVDIPKKYDAWNIDAEELVKMTPIHEVDSVQLVEKGPLRSSIRIERYWGKSKFVQYVSLSAGSQQVDVANDFDWQETHVLLKAAFPLAASSSQATYEIPYGTIQRPTTRNNPVEKAKFEVPALRWADLGDASNGFSLINQTKYGYDAAGNVLRLSLLRSTMYPAPNADKGHQQFMYSLYPHAGTWQQAMTVRHGYELNYGLSAMQTTSHAGPLPATHSFITVKGDAVVLTAVKKAEDSNSLVLRMFEWQGKTSAIHITVPGHPSSAEEVGMMESDAGSVQNIQGSTISTTANPFEIKTMRVDYSEKNNDIWAGTH